MEAYAHTHDGGGNSQLSRLKITPGNKLLPPITWGMGHQLMRGLLLQVPIFQFQSSNRKTEDYVYVLNKHKVLHVFEPWNKENEK